eukprot:m51a1_g6437 putative dual specificity protein phosphatase 19 (268) ;mRNA; r:370323-371250
MGWFVRRYSVAAVAIVAAVLAVAVTHTPASVVQDVLRDRASAAALSSARPLSDVVSPGVLVGSYESSMQYPVLAARNVSYVVAVTSGNVRVPPALPGSAALRYLSLRAMDVPDVALIDAFADIAAFAARARASGASVLFHCRMGVSRSSTAAAASIIAATREPVQVVLSRMQSGRPAIKPNAGFMQQLEYWYGCVSSNSTEGCAARWRAQMQKEGRRVRPLWSVKVYDRADQEPRCLAGSCGPETLVDLLQYCWGKATSRLEQALGL